MLSTNRKLFLKTFISVNEQKTQMRKKRITIAHQTEDFLFNEGKYEQRDGDSCGLSCVEG